MIDERVKAGLERQLEDWRAALAGGAQRLGWKIGLNIPEIQRSMGISEPVVGHMTSESLVSSGGTYDATGAEHLRAELEVALEVGEDGEVAGYAVALELVDVGRPPDGIEGIVAGNIFHRAVVLGLFQAELPQLPLTATLTIAGTAHPAQRPPDDPAETVACVARQLETAGEQVRAGDRIIAGAMVHEQARPGEHVVGEIAGLGRIEVAISG